MSPLPETLVHYRTDLEEAIGREQAARLRQGRRRQRLVALVAGILVVGLLVTPAFGIGSRLLDLIESAPGAAPDVQAPVWSPDGRRIAFLSRRDGRQGGLTSMSADGSGQRSADRATRGSRPLLPGRPTGGRSSSKPGATRRVYVVNADGSGQRRLARERGRSCLVARRADDRVLQRQQDLPHERRRERAPAADERGHGRAALAWSPDGRKLAFLEARLRPELRRLRHEQRRERHAEADAAAGRRSRARPGRPTGGRSHSSSRTRRPARERSTS